jgi:hypothetical protein
MVGGHLADYISGEASAFAFLSAILNGSYASKYQTMGCTIQNVTMAIDPSPQLKGSRGIKEREDIRV